MGFFRFQTKLFLAISVVVAAALVGVLVVTQAKVREVYGRLFEERFTAQVDSFLELQETRLGVAAEWCAEAADSDLVREVLNGKPKREILERLKRELEGREFRLGGRPVKENAGASKNAGQAKKPGGGVSARMRPSMVALIDTEGKILPVAGGVVGRGRGTGRERVKKLSEVIGESDLSGRQEIGYMAVGEESPELVEVVAAAVRESESGALLGALVAGIPNSGFAERLLMNLGRGGEGERIIGGRLLDGVLYSKSVTGADGERIAEQVTARSEAGEEEGDFETEVHGRPYRVHFQALNPGSALPVAYNVALFPLTELRSELAAMRVKTIGFGLGALALGFLAAYVLAHRISVPIRDLSSATERVRGGDFSPRVAVRSKDELGELAGSFNEMADGLAQREKIRSILGMVVDEQVARELVEGALELGGEERVASVLFCDIRGFTAMTEGMAPQEVIGLVNGHMTAMTEVVRRHHGVVDKFVGDLIMAVFGVPKSYGEDAGNAVRCALDMVEERRRMNAEGGQRIEIGIGVATGEVVAGRMGGANRLEYTVLGERVNLASRLCGVAGEGEVVVDGETVEQAGGGIVAVKMAPVNLKGFRGDVVAFRVVPGDGAGSWEVGEDGRPADSEEAGVVKG